MMRTKFNIEYDSDFGPTKCYQNLETNHSSVASRMGRTERSGEHRWVFYHVCAIFSRRKCFTAKSMPRRYKIFTKKSTLIKCFYDRFIIEKRNPGIKIPDFSGIENYTGTSYTFYLESRENTEMGRNNTYLASWSL